MGELVQADKPSEANALLEKMKSLDAQDENMVALVCIPYGKWLYNTGRDWWAHCRFQSCLEGNWLTGVRFPATEQIREIIVW
jgi:hypothetical protein